MTPVVNTGVIVPRKVREILAGRYRRVSFYCGHLLRRLEPHPPSMLAKKFDLGWMMVGTPELTRAPLEPGSNRHAIDPRFRDEAKVILQSKMAVFEESVMQRTVADHVREPASRIEAVRPTRHVAGHQQLGIAGVAQRTVPTVDGHCQSTQHTGAHTQPRCADLTPDRDVRHEQRIARYSGERRPFTPRLTILSGGDRSRARQPRQRFRTKCLERTSADGSAKRSVGVVLLPAKKNRTARWRPRFKMRMLPTFHSSPRTDRRRGGWCDH